jgi:hypothetical protein
MEAQYLYTMAFQVGEIKISGTIDDISFYNSLFGWPVRTKGGPSRKQFKRLPAFARPRENSNEFSLCSKAASVIRKIIINHANPKPRTIKLGTLYHRLIKLMCRLADTDKTSVRGQRDPLKGIHTAQGKLLLKDFEITEGLNLYIFLLSINYIQETPCKKVAHTRVYSFSLKRRRKKRHVFHSRTTKVLPRTREPAFSSAVTQNLLSALSQSP